MPERELLTALGAVLRSVEAVRNTRALFVLLGTFAAGGLLVAMASASFAGEASAWGPLQAGAAMFVAFYGANAAGILMMDDVRGVPVRDVPAALRAALATAHRLLLVLAVVGAVCIAAAAVLLGLMWLSRTATSGPVIGPWLFGAAVPIGVVAVGFAALALTAVVVPLAAPAVWSGAGVGRVVGLLVTLVRRRLLTVVLLMSAVSLLTAAAGAIVTSAVMLGGRVVAELGVRVVGVEVPAQQLMAGLFGVGVRSLGAAGAAATTGGHVGAALVGGGIVFALALLLPGLVYLRGTCAVYLAMAHAPPLPPPA